MMCSLFARCISQKMACFCFRPLLLILLISECRAASSGTETVSGHQGGDVVLSCLNPNVMDPNSNYRVQWKKYVTNTRRMEVIFQWPQNLQNPKRMKWEADENGKRGLHLSKLQKSDEGLYNCEIYEGWDIVLSKNISLKVKDCKALPPVTAAPGTSVQLNCPVNVTSGQQNVSWVMLKGNNPISIDSKRFQVNGTSLVSRSVTTSDSGWYRCNHILGQTQCCLVINLLVQEVRVVFEATTVPLIKTTAQQVTVRNVAWTNRMEESSGALIALVTSVVLGIVIIAALIGLFMYRRSKNQSINYRDHTADSMSGYECVDLPGSQDPARSIHCNSLYHCQDENLHTFLR
ncbi:uncharacterized protein LOC110969061 [Acanthochromis polyacanthus]|uniref:uncharacterized protein LOC110969061 n=1 Tax=Acanthochromis polyacanthus TaxID=80966 RepID=UPI0022348134|nr:uncharacterized protein LOC110969061 [Acanthochromis polyacanthus]